eukprot:Gregarina_sp_Poly_1__1045@NODE_1257_length_4605_cov_172_351476_g336_i1_p1_GENE_NODE_1257_length_4605_cov_172_351476_g336_i1NODE_1257_length_4605_cov_172_351476_g336_i1_p1_ORF_typecomplete_len789_score112_765_nucleotid_C/PF02872_18/3_1e33Metallophos/PF00149_28/1_1e06PGA_cap/PF09587_10/0_087PGA_cap/PF09587_10/8_5e02_NODE_1257_length_4605_cov_172_351476_g336_i11562522
MKLCLSGVLAGLTVTDAALSLWTARWLINAHTRANPATYKWKRWPREFRAAPVSSLMPATALKPVFRQREFLVLEGTFVVSDSVTSETDLRLKLGSEDAVFVSDDVIRVPPLNQSDVFTLSVVLWVPLYLQHEMLTLHLLHVQSATLLRLAVPASKRPPLEYHLFFVNDFHGRIGTDITTVKSALGLVLAAQLQRQRQLHSKAAGFAFITAGDNIGGSPFESATLNDEPTLELLNRVGTNLSVLGNHELDKGFSFFSDFILPRCAFTYICANMHSASGQLQNMSRSKILELGKDDHTLKLGVIGVVTADMPALVNLQGLQGLSFSDPVEAINEEVPRLQARGADLIFVLAHQGAEGDETATTLETELGKDTEFSRIVRSSHPAITAIITAHTHKEYNWKIPVTQENSSAFSDRLVMQAGCYGSRLGHLRLEVDPADKSLKGIAARNIPMSEGFDDYTLANAIKSNPTLQSIAEVINDAIEVSAAAGAVEIGRLTEGLTHPHRNVETPLCNLVADSLLDTVTKHGFKADLSLQNPGGVRANLDPADNVVTQKDIATVMAFGNAVRIVELTGESIVKALEQQWRRDGSVERLCHSGMTYWYNESAAVGSKVDVSSVLINGVQVDIDSLYRVVTNEFLASGGDKFTAMREHKSSTDTPFTDDQTLSQFIATQSPVSPDLIERAVDYRFYVGDQVSFTVETIEPGYEGDETRLNIRLSTDTVSVKHEIVIFLQSQSSVTEIARLEELVPGKPHTLIVYAAQNFVRNQFKVIAIALVFDNNPFGPGIEATSLS